MRAYLLATLDGVDVGVDEVAVTVGKGSKRGGVELLQAVAVASRTRSARARGVKKRS
jgi:hypothetical protein